MNWLDLITVAVAVVVATRSGYEIGEGIGAALWPDDDRRQRHLARALMLVPGVVAMLTAVAFLLWRMAR